MTNPDATGLLVSKRATDQVVDRELDGLFRRNTDQLGENTRVQALETFVGNNLSEAIDRVIVQTLAGVGTSLVLHAGLDKINGINHEGTKGTGNTTE